MMSPCTLNQRMSVTERRMPVLVLLSLLVFSGCGTRELKLQGTSEDAIVALQQALNAWKAGEKPDQLFNETVIRAVDYEWNAGTALLNYTIEKPAKPEGSNWKVSAYLVYGVSGQQASYPNQAAYTVTLEPSLNVFRLDTLD